MKRSVISIGNFDGVHLGHQALVREARSLAQRVSAGVMVVTFDPHPAQVLSASPGSVPAAITGLSERVALLKEAGADEVRVIRPTPELLSQEPEAFVQHLIDHFGMAGIVEGPDFHFGRHRRGDMPMLQALGQKLGFETVVVPPVMVAMTNHTLVEARSTLVRWLLGHGRVADVTCLLGRAFSVTSEVVRGEQRGRTIGVPTVNLDLAPYEGRALPAQGVYAGVGVLEDGSRFPAAISLGRKPTFGVVGLTLEAHLLGFSGDLYGRRMTLEFRRWVRDQERFASVEKLKVQLARDIAQAALVG